MLLADLIGKTNKTPSLSSIALHVQTNNENAIRLYEGFGFAITETIEGFYQRNVEDKISYHSDCHAMALELPPWPQRRLAAG